MEELLKRFTVEELNKNCLIELHDFLEFSLDYYEKSSDGSFSPYEKMRQNLEFCKDYAENFSSRSPSLFFFGKTRPWKDVFIILHSKKYAGEKRKCCFWFAH